MFIDKRRNKSGIYYSFSYMNDEGIRVRLKKSEYPHFTNEEDARAWANSQSAQRQSQKDQLKKKLAWRTQFYEFPPLVEKFTKHQIEQAPNSYENSVFYLEHYALYWFLNIKKQNNINGWHFIYHEYRQWLSEEAVTLQGTKLAYSTRNKAIHALNSFLGFLASTGDISQDAAKKCPAYADSLLNVKGFESVIDQQEFEYIHKRLIDIDPPSADFWYILYHTGMRFSEAYGLPLTALFSGKTDGSLDAELTQHKMDYVGYLVLESQPESKFRKRELDGTIKRKPLKGRKTIHPKNNRIIPILDKSAWNILARRYKQQKAMHEQNVHGGDKVNYMLFDDVQYSKMKRSLTKAYKDSPYPENTWHNARHSYCTFMVGRTRSFFLARAVLGHKSKAFERYLHIYEQMSLRAKQNTMDIDEIV